jgi:hypothetical protein
MARQKAQKPQETKVSVTLNGLTDIMFDRYAGDNKTTLRVDQKLYLSNDATIVLPSLNVMSLLSAQNTPSAPKRFLDSRKYKAVAQAILSYVYITPFEIPFLRDGKPIQFHGLGADGVDKKAQVYTHHGVARLDKGIPNPKERPALGVPWQLRFVLSMFRNDEVQEETVQNLLIRGGMAIGLGTFRGVYGKFQVAQWEPQ